MASQKQMAKKIAQLTKVVHRLNTLYEDQQLKLEANENAHKEDVANIINDAGKKYSDLKVEAQEKEKCINNLSDSMGCTRIKHEQERIATEMTLTKIQLKHRDEIERRKCEYTSNHRKTVKEANEAYAVREDEFLSSMKKNSCRAKEEVHRLEYMHKAEIKCIISGHEGALQALQMNHKEKMTNIIETSTIEKERAIAIAESSMDKQISELRLNFTAHNELTIAHVNDKATREIEAGIKFYKHKLQQFEVTNESSAIQVKSLVTRLYQANILSTENEEKIASIRDSFAAEKIRCANKITELQEHERKLQSESQINIEALLFANDKILSLTDTIKESNATTLERAKENTRLSNELKGTLGGNQYLISHHNIYKESKEVEEIVLNKRISCLKQDNNRLKSHIVHSLGFLDHEVCDIQKCAEQVKRSFIDLMAEIVMIIQMVKRKAEINEKKSLTNFHQAQKEALVEKLDINLAWEKNTSDIINKAAKKSSRALIKIAEKTKVKEIDAMKKIDDLNKKLGDSTSQLKEERICCDKELRKIRGVFQIDKANLVEKKNIIIQERNIEIGHLKKAVDSLEAKISQLANSEKSALQLHKEKIECLCKDHNIEIDLLSKSHADVVDSLQRQISDNEKATSISLKSLTKNHESDINELTEKNVSTKNAREEEFAREVEELKSQQQKSISSLNKDHDKVLHELESRYSEKENAREEEFARQAEELKRRQQGIISSLTIDHDKNLHDLEFRYSVKEKHIDEERNQLVLKNRMGEQALLAVKETSRHSESVHRETTRSIEQRLTSKFHDGLRREEMLWNDCRLEFEQQLESVSDELEATKKEGKVKLDRICSLEHKLDVDAKEAINKLETMKASNMKVTKEIQKEAVNKDTALRKDTEVHINDLNLKIKDLEAEANHFKTRSRPEDIARISCLERNLLDTQKSEKKLKEDSIFYKRELHNREENFNSRFTGTSNSNAKVGVMNVIRQGKQKSKGKENRVAPVHLGVRKKVVAHSSIR